MSAPELEQSLQLVLEPEIEALGFECLEVTFGSEGGRRILRLVVDGPDGITLDECAVLSRALGPVLESVEALAAKYVLEVSSPGINRPLTKPAHWERFVGETVKVRLKEKQDGGATVTGILRGVRDGVAVLETPVGERRVALDQVSRARLHRDIEAILRASRKTAGAAQPEREPAEPSRRKKR